MSNDELLLKKIRIWSYGRQRLKQDTDMPLEALRDVIGVYSSHPTAPLSLLARSASFNATSLSEMEQRKEAVRIPAMRLSIFLVPTKMAARIFAATRQPLEKRESNLRYAGLDWDEYARLKSLILEHTQQPIPSNDLQKAIQTDGRLMTAVRFMGYEGLVFRLGSSLRSDSLLYVSAEVWLGHPLKELDPQESLRWLAREYLRCFGPARVKDFAWWSGISQRLASTALSDIATVTIGKDLLLLTEQQDAFEHSEPIADDTNDAIAVLPKWDAYTMGYAPDGRQRFVDDQHLQKAYTHSGTAGRGGTMGDGLPLLLRGGRAVASWSHRFEGNRMTIKVAPFEPATLQPAFYEHAFATIGELLGATSITMTTAEEIPEKP